MPPLCVPSVCGGIPLAAWQQSAHPRGKTEGRAADVRPPRRESDELKASGQLEQLAGSFARLDPPLAGCAPRGRAAAPGRALPRRAGSLAGAVDAGRCPSAGAAPAVGRRGGLRASIASRPGAPRPRLYDVAGWASGAAVHELLGDPRGSCSTTTGSGRALEILAVYAETSARHGRGRPCDRALRGGRRPAARRPDRAAGVPAPMRTRRSSPTAGRQGQARRSARSARCRPRAADGVALVPAPGPGQQRPS